jgi:hypothetical protein
MSSHRYFLSVTCELRTGIGKTRVRESLWATFEILTQCLWKFLSGGLTSILYNSSAHFWILPLWWRTGRIRASLPSSSPYAHQFAQCFSVAYVRIASLTTVCLLSLHIHPEDGGRMFFLSVGKLPPRYTSSRSRRYMCHNLEEITLNRRPFDWICMQGEHFRIWNLVHPTAERT